MFDIGTEKKQCFDDYENGSLQPEIIRCKECKYNPKNPRRYDDNDIVQTYDICLRLAYDGEAFCSMAKRNDNG